MGEEVRVKVVPCEVYSRVVGYYRPVSAWNDGKKQEFFERKTMRIPGELNWGRLEIEFPQPKLSGG